MTLRAFLAQHGADVRARPRRRSRARGRARTFPTLVAAPRCRLVARVMKSAETSAETFRKRGRAATAAAAMLDAAGGVGGGGRFNRVVWMTRRRARRRTAASEGRFNELLPVARTPGTARGPRRGEVLYSINGSPLGALAVEDGEFDRLEQNDANGAPSSCVKRVTMTSRRDGGQASG